MKLWAHHIPKKNLSIQVTLPSVPVFDEEEYLSEMLRQGNRTLSCVAGHSADIMVDEDLGLGMTDWPHWPTKFNFQAKAYGPYPFWQFGTDYISGYAPQWKPSQTFTELYGEGGDLEVWHNTIKRATKFYHATCAWDYVGYGELGQRPAIALQFGIYDTVTHPEELVGNWLLFTANASTRNSDGAFCCSAKLSAAQGKTLGTINRKFMDNMKYVGNIDFHGRFYEGPAKRYIFAMDTPGGKSDDQSGPSLPLEVWYETDLHDKPVRFAEIGRNSTYLNDHDLKSSDLPLLYEEIDPTSISEDFSDTVFEIPEVCKAENLPQCSPGPQSRHGVDLES